MRFLTKTEAEKNAERTRPVRVVTATTRARQNVRGGDFKVFRFHVSPPLT